MGAGAAREIVSGCNVIIRPIEYRPVSMPAPSQVLAFALLTILTSHRTVALAATEVDFPGTAVDRLGAAVERAKDLQGRLDADFETARSLLVDACGLRGPRTGHCFTDATHVDCCTMVDDVADELNGGRSPGIHPANFLGDAIRDSVNPDLGIGGSWCTCQHGVALGRDVCHAQFQSKVAFKLVWCPSADGQHSSFALVDEDGHKIAGGQPQGALPPLSHRRANWEMVQGSRFAAACDE